jgi:DNA polymerase-3 subunit alpha
VAAAADIKLKPAVEATASEKLVWEKELLGLYLSGHPLDKYRAVLDTRDMNVKKAKEELQEGMIVVLGGIIEEAKPILTKKGDTMMFVRLADFTGTLEVVVFPKTFTEFRTMLVPENCVAVKGRFSNRNGNPSLIVEKIKQL